MKERPILFSGAMVRALMAGTKTQTRRTINTQPVPNHRGKFDFQTTTDDEGIESYWYINPLWGPIRCPYGKPGDRLWVRETWIPPHHTINPCHMDRLCYRATNPQPEGMRWRPSIHMPRWASRILLEITDVRVERLQEISDADSVAEGTPCYVCGGPLNGLSEDDCHCFHRKATANDYRILWEAINGPESWEANCWVWVVEFKVLKP